LPPGMEMSGSVSEVQAHGDGAGTPDDAGDGAKCGAVIGATGRGRIPISSARALAGGEGGGNGERSAGSVNHGELVEIVQRGLLIGGAVAGNDLPIVKVVKGAVVV